MSEPSDSPIDRLQRVRVFGLFGAFDHDIPLSAEGGITVIHGPNGVGKTIILRMIDEVLNRRPDVLRRIPFDTLELHFRSGDVATVTKNTDGEDLLCHLHHAVSGTTEDVNLIGGLESLPPKLGHYVRRFVPAEWEYDQINETWVDQTDGETISLVEGLTRFHVPPKTVKEVISVIGTERGAFNDKCRVYMIGTDRLTRSGRARTRSQRMFRPWSNRQSRPDDQVRAVVFFAQDLASRIRENLASYGRVTERLDRTLMRRLLGEDQVDHEGDELLALSKEIEVKRRRLIELGLLDVDEEDDPLKFEDDTSSSADKAILKESRLFSIYLEDQREKLGVFDELQGKLEILKGRIGERFQLKSLEIDRESGFKFVTPSGVTLRPGDLSSGEQHEIILIYELLFLIQDGDLILIDEPELSLHLEWQMTLVSDLQSIFRASAVDVVLATHSPAIAESVSGELVELTH